MYIKDSNALLYRLQVLLFPACYGPLGFVYLLQILTWYQVSQLRVKHLLTSLCLPEKSSISWGLPASPYHKPPSCFRSRFRRDFPRVLLGSALGGGYARSMETVSSHSALELSASPRRKIFFTFPDFTLQLRLLRYICASQPCTAGVFLFFVF